MGVLASDDNNKGKSVTQQKRERSIEHLKRAKRHHHHMEMAKSLHKSEGGMSVPEEEKEVGYDATVEALGKFRQRLRSSRAKMKSKFPAGAR